MKKLNNKGISELIIALIVVVIGVAAFGTYKLVSSSAKSRSTVYSKLSGRSHIRGANTQFELKVRGGSTKVSKVTIGGKKTKKSVNSRGDAYFRIAVRGQHYHSTRMTKVYNNQRKLIWQGDILYKTAGFRTD